MNNELIKSAIKIFLQNIDIKGRAKLESFLEISLDELLFEILSSIYEYNKKAISSISCEDDTTDDYIFKDTNGEYSLDVFLINRLLKNIRSINCEEQQIFPNSHYDADFREILFDSGRFETLNKAQIRKIDYHEFLHALKTDFINYQFFKSREYFELKEKIKRMYPDLVNDFNIKASLPEDSYEVKRHIGLRYCRNSGKTDYNSKGINNVDEILNEADSIILSNDQNAATLRMKDSDRMLLVYNPESSNVSITNFGLLLKAMLNKKTVFIGQYLEPSFLIYCFNKLYTDIFRRNFNIDDTAWNIYSTIISKIKEEQTEDLYIALFDTIYDCIKYKSELLVSSGYESKFKQDLKDLKTRGLVEQIGDISFVVSSVAKYKNKESSEKHIS